MSGCNWPEFSGSQNYRFFDRFVTLCDLLRSYKEATVLGKIIDQEDAKNGIRNNKYRCIFNQNAH